MTNLTCLASFSILICLASFVSIPVVILVVGRRRASKDSDLDSVDITKIATSAPSLSGIEETPDKKKPSDPQMALALGKHLLVQSKRAEGVALLMHALREGPPDVRQEAICTLEELDEIETF